MCAPGCIEHVSAALSRRMLLQSTAAAIAGTGAAALAATASPAAAQQPRFSAFSRTLDLTHTLTPEFPTFNGAPGIAIRNVKTFKPDGYNLREWRVAEHSGTHIDAPIHFSASGPGPAELAIDQLVVPLAVIDVAGKAEADRDYRLSPDDVKAWEKANGALPAGACVAMRSGWDRHVASTRFAGRDSKGTLHFPGFHPETAAMLLSGRQIAGIAVDTLSLDHGASKDFRTHYTWLGAGRWGLECVANLASVPARGATLVVGAPKLKDATGGPTRVLALL
jgi:kynurenine formamidase